MSLYILEDERKHMASSQSVRGIAKTSDGTNICKHMVHSIGLCNRDMIICPGEVSAHFRRTFAAARQTEPTVGFTRQNLSLQVFMPRVHRCRRCRYFSWILDRYTNGQSEGVIQM